MRIVNWFKVRKNRVYLYVCLVATGPVLGYYGLATDDEIQMWAGVLQTVLGLTAMTYTDKKEQ